MTVASREPGASRATHDGPRGSYRADIDGLRAVAVVAVVLFHYGLAGCPGGFVGVDVFFVISGYLITAIARADLARGRFTLGRFYERRLRRIVPAFAAMLLACGAASFFVFLPEDMRLLGRSVGSAALFGSNILFHRVAGDYFNADNLTLQPLLHTWSLAVEAQFYLLYPLLLLALKGRPGATAGAIAGIAAASFASSAWGTAHAPAATFYLLPSRAWELLAGSTLALALPARDRVGAEGPLDIDPRWAVLLVAAGLAAIAAPVFGYGAATPFPGVAALPPCLGAVLVILGGSRPNRLSACLGAQPLAWLGRISYSLYLWHWPLLVMVRYGRGTDLPLATRLLLLATTVLLSAASHALIERPFIAGRVLPSRRWLLAGAGAATAIALALGVTLDLTGRGLLPLARLPADVLTLAEGHYDRIEGECPVPPAPDAAAPYPCRFGAEDAAPSVVLWGNSYARMWVPGLDREARQHDAAGLALIFSKCPPLVGLAIPALPGCGRFNDAALAFVAAHPEIRKVVLGADWFGYGDAVQELGTTLAGLQAVGVDVVVLLAPPQADYSVPRTLAIAALRHEPPPPSPREAAAREAQRSSTDIIAALRDRFGFGLIDPATAMCDGVRCPVVRDGHPLFYDAGHVTVFAARHLDGLFAGVFGP